MNRLGAAAFFIVSMLPTDAGALVDLDAPSPVLPQYARETLQSENTTEAASDGTVYYNVIDAGADNDIQTALGVGIAADDRVFLRFQLGNAVLAPGNNALLAVNVRIPDQACH